MSRKQAWGTITVFCILIFGFTIATIFNPTVDFSETENRVLAQRPALKVRTLLNGDFEADYEEYLTDQFILRDTWVGLKTGLERLLQKRESKDIYFADDNYLIEKHTASFVSDTAQSNITVLSQFVKKYQEQLGTEHISVMVVPNAVEILQDKLPPFAPPSHEGEYLKQITRALPKDSWFDTERILREHEEEDIYYKTDHHWKTLAAFYVYQEWAKAQGYHVPVFNDYQIEIVTNSFEGTIQSKLGIKTAGDTIELFKNRKETDFTVQREGSESLENSLYDYTALDTKDKYAVYLGGNTGLLKISTNAECERKILVIKDSYANCFIPFMLGEFQVIDVVDLRYDRQRLSKRIAEGGYTDILFLYNASGFAEDTNISRLMS